jgi:hypothetical protein
MYYCFTPGRSLGLVCGMEYLAKAIRGSATWQNDDDPKSNRLERTETKRVVLAVSCCGMGGWNVVPPNCRAGIAAIPGIAPRRIAFAGDCAFARPVEERIGAVGIF